MASLKKRIQSYPLIPEEERKCIWMTTGFISYKLCDRSFQCEACPLDQAIKNEEPGEDDFQESEEIWMEGSLQSDSSTQINGAIFYHPDHCWAQVENPEKVKIGIDDLLVQLIMNVKVVTLPKVGSYYRQGECCAHIIQYDYILSVIAPLSGTIEAVNDRLKKEPELILSDSRGDGWLITIKPGNLESDLKTLLFGRKAISWYQREEKELIARTDLMLQNNNQTRALGPTMQDGGVRIDCLHDMLHSVSSRQRAQILDFETNQQKIVI
jgi:glycine cleavage system H protein